MGRRETRNVHRGLEEVGGLDLGDKGLEGRILMLGKTIERIWMRGGVMWKGTQSSLSTH